MESGEGVIHLSLPPSATLPLRPLAPSLNPSPTLHLPLSPCLTRALAAEQPRFCFTETATHTRASAPAWVGETFEVLDEEHPPPVPRDL
jgi:hypothetical protein